MKYLKNFTIKQLHGILTTYEMRKVSPTNIIEAAFKANEKGKEKEESGYVSK